MEAGTRQTEAGDSGWLGGGSEGMETITAILRQAREHKGVSLKDVEGKTRIPLKYLQALEGGGETGLLADEMYLIPFLRSYANFLGVDANQAVTRFLTELQRQDAAIVAPPERRPPVVTPRSGPSRLASWVVPFLLLLVILLLGSYLWQQGHLQTLVSWWQSGSTKEELAEESPVSIPPSSSVTAVVPESAVAVVPSPATTPDSSSSSPVAPPTSVPTVQGSPTSGSSAPATPPSSIVAVVPHPESPTAGAPTSQMPTVQGSPTSGSPSPTATTAVVPQSESPVVTAVSPATTAPPAGGHRLSIRASSSTWLRVVVDSQPGKDLILKAGETREWTAQDGFTVSLGNAGGAILNLDGQDLPPAGKPGQIVRNIRIPAPAAATGQ